MAQSEVGITPPVTRGDHRIRCICRRPESPKIFVKIAGSVPDQRITGERIYNSRQVKSH